MKVKSNLDLANDKIPKLFLNYFIPMLFAMLATASYSTVDGIFVNKKLGDDAMKAIVATWPIFPFVMACSLVFGLGASSMIGYYLAKRREQLARIIFSSIVYFIFPLSLIIGLSIYFYADYFISLFIKNLSPEIHTMSVEYLSGIGLGLFGMIMHPILDICVINDKRPRFAMFAMFFGAACNIVLNYLFLFVMETGIIGSAYATVLGHIIGGLILLFHYFRRDRILLFIRMNVKIRFIRKALLFCLIKKGDLYFVSAFNIVFIRRSFKYGAPYAASELSVSFIMWLYNQVLKDIGGEDSLAIYSAILYAGFNFFTVLLSLAESIQPIASFNYGLRQFDRLNSLLKFYITVELCLSAFIYSIFFFFDEYIAAAFLKDSQLRSISAQAMGIYFLGFIPLGLSLIIGIFLQALQRALASFIVTLSYTLVFLGAILPIISHFYGVSGAWVSYPISQICALCVSFAVLKYEIKKGLFSNK